MNEDRVALENLIGGFKLSSLVALAAKLRLADHLSSGPRTAGELAALTSCHEDSLYRALRALAGLGIVTEELDRRFRLTPCGEYLRSDVPGSLKIAAEIVAENWTWQPWGALLHSVRSGETAFDHLFGESTWSWFSTNPEAAALFNQHMDVRTSADAEALLAAFDFFGIRTIVDVGGGQGSLLAAILRRHPGASGVLVNLPHVIESVNRSSFYDLGHRLEFASGDFFHAVPDGADLYILKDILHDWNDDQAQKILETCRAAMHARSVLLVIEYLICPPNQHCAGKVVDIQMMVRTGGRNRTQEEFRDLFNRSGFGEFRLLRPDTGPDLLAVRCGKREAALSSAQ
jgi:hypothetical protein